MLRRYGGASDRQHPTTGRTPQWYDNYHTQIYLRPIAPPRFANTQAALADEQNHLLYGCIVSSPALLGDHRAHERAQIDRLFIELGGVLGRQQDELLDRSWIEFSLLLGVVNCFL